MISAPFCSTARVVPLLPQELRAKNRNDGNYTLEGVARMPKASCDLKQPQSGSSSLSIANEL